MEAQPADVQPNWEVNRSGKMIRIADAKEVGVGNPAEETYRYPNRTEIKIRP